MPRDGDQGQERYEQLVSNIVAATNWQNAILPSDLRANDARQVLLQRELAKLRYHYLRKRQTKKEAKRLLGNQHWFWMKKEELAQVVAACELDPVTVRGGKEGLFQHPHYDSIFDGRSLREYLSMYWMGRVVKYEGAGYPDRAYAKWHAMHFLWKRLRPLLRGEAAADHFRTLCERNRCPSPLRSATNEVYRALLRFFKATRGKGPHAVDISNFFYRPHQHKAFETYWHDSLKSRAARFKKLMQQFEAEMETAIKS